MAPLRDTTELAVIKLACKIKQIDICLHTLNEYKEGKRCLLTDGNCAKSLMESDLSL